MDVYYYTFGCKVNQYETELLKQKFAALGFGEAKAPIKAQLCVINSCTVTSQSDLKLRQLLHRIRRENPAAAVAVCGCYPKAFGESAPGLDFADIILGADNKQRLPEIFEEYLKSPQRTVDLGGGGSLYPEGEKMSFGTGKTRAIIKIQDGCDRFCSYCIIPYARGRSRSKPIKDIRTEAETLVKAGHKELVIVGINLSDYGKGGNFDLADAVKAAAESGAERIRLGSLEPEELSENIIRRLAEIKNLCPHFHLALQSGCDKTLREMRRKYDTAEYLKTAGLFRELFPGCALTTDIMVGFPGESDEDFEKSLEFVKKIGFAEAHIFPYSPRSGTKAAERTDAVPPQIKETRAKIMAEAVAESSKSFKEAMVGGIYTVLFEKEKTPEFHRGHTANYQAVKVKRFTDTMFRKTAGVKITAAGEDCLYGEII